MVVLICSRPTAVGALCSRDENGTVLCDSQKCS